MNNKVLEKNKKSNNNKISYYVPPKKHTSSSRKKISTSARTLKELKRQGIPCALAERFNPYVGEHGIRQDLFGFIDVIAIKNNAITAIQCCSGSSYSAHYEKIIENENAYDWVTLGNGRIEIWAWRKVKAKRGGKLEVWKPRIKVLTEHDFTDTFNCADNCIEEESD